MKHLIIGNPPYKDESFTNELGKRSRTAGRGLDCKIFKKCRKASGKVVFLMIASNVKRKDLFTDSIYVGRFPGVGVDVGIFVYEEGKSIKNAKIETSIKEIENSLYGRIRLAKIAVKKYKRDDMPPYADFRGFKVPEDYIAMTLRSTKVDIFLPGEIPHAYSSLIYARGCEKKLKEYIMSRSEQIVARFKEEHKRKLEIRITMCLKEIEDFNANI